MDKSLDCPRVRVDNDGHAYRTMDEGLHEYNLLDSVAGAAGGEVCMDNDVDVGGSDGVCGGERAWVGKGGWGESGVGG